MPEPADDVILNDTERQSCEVWSRVMGYFRPVSQWNTGKQAEYKERINFRLPLNLEQF